MEPRRVSYSTAPSNSPRSAEASRMVREPFSSGKRRNRVSSAVSGARKSLTWLASLLVLLFALLSVGVLTNQTGATPGLGLDLAGGRQIILQARTTDGSQICLLYTSPSP